MGERRLTCWRGAGWRERGGDKGVGGGRESRAAGARCGVKGGERPEARLMIGAAG
jgi:hypothetical protein